MSSSKLLLGTAGIYIAYLTNSLLQEKMFTVKYPNIDNKKGADYFEYSDLLQLFTSVFCLVFSLINATIKKQPSSPLPIKQRVILGVLYFINVGTLNYCLFYIPYPMKVVGDKLGYLSAVVIGVFFSRIKKTSKFKLGREKMVIAVMITFGTLIFSYFYKVKKNSQVLYNPDEMWIGFVLLGISVITEAMFSDSQAYNKLTYKPTINHLITAVSASSFFLSITVLIVKNELFKSFQFLVNHKNIFFDLILYSFLTVLGQVSIYSIILNFKQHMFPLISTTRKVFTVLLSFYAYNHHMNVWLWIGLVFVFGGLIYELIDELYYDLTGEKAEKIVIKSE